MTDETTTKAFEAVLTSRGNKCKSAKQALKVLSDASGKMAMKIAFLNNEVSQFEKSFAENNAQYQTVQNEQAAIQAAKADAKLQKLEAERAELDKRIEAAKGAK
jgi:predicted  nucleic acid-binding Zn-ribbon protein